MCYVFSVIVIRKIAQMISEESKYAGVLQSLLLIGNEEGIGGLFSYVHPRLLSTISSIQRSRTATNRASDCHLGNELVNVCHRTNNE